MKQSQKFGYKKSGLITRLACFGRKKDGVVSIEAALLFPFMILLVLGMIDITSVISMKRKVTVAASAVVDLTTQQTATVTTADLNNYIQAADAILAPRAASGTNVELINYRRNGSNVDQSWTHSRGGCAGNSNMTGATLTRLTAEQNDILVGRICINFQPIVGYVLGTGTIAISETVAQRPRQGLQLNCSNCP